MSPTATSHVAVTAVSLPMVPPSRGPRVRENRVEVGYPPPHGHGRRDPARAHLPQAPHRDRQPDQRRPRHPGDPGRPEGRDGGPRLGRAGHDLRARHEEPGAVLAVQGGSGGPRDPGPEDVRLDRRLHRPLPQDREHRERLRRGGARERSTRSLRFDARWDKASGFKTHAGALGADPVRQVPAGRPAAREQEGRQRVLPTRRRGGGGAREDPRHRLLQPAPRGAHQQAVQVRRPGRQGPRLGEGHREGDRGGAGEPAGRGQGSSSRRSGFPRTRS